jgi:tetratricopeptide (TPR) repeat protein
MAPQNQLAWLYLAWSYGSLGDFPKAEAAYRALIAINPKHTHVYTTLGYAYWKMGRVDEAMASYRKQMELDPHDGYASWNLATELASRGRWDEALRFAAVSAEGVPDDPRRWDLLGRAQIRTGRVDEARQSLDRALALPHGPMIDNNIAWEMAAAGFDLDKSWRLISGALENSARLVCEPEELSGADKCTGPLRQLALMLDTAGWVLYRQGKSKEA